MFVFINLDSLIIRFAVYSIFLLFVGLGLMCFLENVQFRVAVRKNEKQNHEYVYMTACLV